MVATDVPISKPTAPCPRSKRSVEARALLPMIYVARLSCPQVAEKCPAASSPFPCQCVTSHSGERTSGRGGWWGLARGWSVILRWARSPSCPTVWRSRAPLLTRGAASCHLARRDGSAEPQTPPAQTMPSRGAHLGEVPGLPSPETREPVLQHLSVRGGRAELSAGVMWGWGPSYSHGSTPNSEGVGATELQIPFSLP